MEDPAAEINSTDQIKGKDMTPIDIDQEAAEDSDPRAIEAIVGAAIEAQAEKDGEKAKIQDLDQNQDSEMMSES